MIEGNRALEMLAEHRTNEVVITTMSTARTWPAISSRPELDYPLRGCMGKASSLGLGIVLARPDVRALVLDGDGSLLMNLGSVVTVASQAPGNLVHVVFDGATYDTSGAQPTPGKDIIDWRDWRRRPATSRPPTSRAMTNWHSNGPRSSPPRGPSSYGSASIRCGRRAVPPGLKANTWQEMQANIAAI